MRKRAKSVALFSALAVLAVSSISCPNLFSDQDLKAKLKDDVKVATARILTLTIESDANGISTPTGAQSAKEGIPIDISTTPFATHAFTSWTKTSGTGNVVFENAALAATRVTVTGGDVNIKPVFIVKPKVLYSTPIGASIPKNSRVTVIFSKNVDPATVSATSLTITENGSGPSLGGQYTVTANMVRFAPNSPLNAYKTYVITATSEIKDTDGVALIENYTSAFKTGNTFDNEPPAAGTFIINDGVAQYTKTREVTLNSISADDDSEITTIRIYDESAYADLYRDFEPTVPWTLSPNEGDKTINMKFTDQIGNETPDPVSRSIILDITPPSGTVTIEGGIEFTKNQEVTLTLSAVDPPIGTKDGSGMVGGQMMISNDSSFAGAIWEGYTTTRTNWSLAAGDGAKTVYVKFMDAVGNAMASAVSDSIYLDKTAPTGTVNGGTVVATNSTSVTVSLTLSDGAGSGVDVVQLVSSGVADGAWSSSAGNSGTITSGAFDSSTPAASAFTFTLSAGEGNKAINFTVLDKLTNSSTVSSTIRYDTTAPTLTGISINGGAASTNTTAVTIAISGAADASGGTITHIGLDNDPGFANPTWIPYAASVTWTLTEGQETKNVYAKLRDAAGNITTAAASDSIYLDLTPPSGSFVISSNATYTKTATVTINSTFSDVVDMRFSNDGTTWSGWVAYVATYTNGWVLAAGDGTKTVYGQYRKASGNVATVTDTIILDTAVPTGTITIIGTGDGSNAYTNVLSGVSLSVSGSDTLSGVNRMRFSTNNGSTWSTWESYTTSKTGLTLSYSVGSTYYVLCQIDDKAGNVSTNIVDTIIYDNVVPSASLSINSGAAWTNNGTVTLNSTASDASSGVWQLSVSNTSGTAGFSAWETYSAARTGWATLNPTVEGSKQVWIKVRDRAGNEVVSAATDTIGVDLTAPVIGTLALNAGAATTPSLQSEITITSSDTGGSGLYQYQLYYNGAYGTWKALSGSPVIVTVDWPFTPNAGTHSVYVKISDVAGNTSGWVYDSITLEVPTPKYAMKGYYSNGNTYVYASTIQQPAGTNQYYFYSTTNATANPNNADPVDTIPGFWTGTYGTDIAAYVPSPVGELRYFFVRVYNSSTGNWGPYSPVAVPGWSANVTIIYDANDSTDTALAQAIKSRLMTSLPSAYPATITGTQPTWSVILIPESMVATTFVSGTTTEAYYRNIIYGDPTIVTPGTSLYGNSFQTHNLVGGSTRGIVGMGFGGTRLLDTINTNWTTWSLTGQQPLDIGYSKSASFATSTVNGYIWTTSNTVWTSPLTSTSITAHNTQSQLSYADLATSYSVYRLAGAALTGGYLYEREPSNSNYFSVAHQGRFLQFGFSTLPDRPYTGGVFFVNLIARMDNY
ncbi:MAG: Ig-like domain-containing protein [Treponemataceae bacterium]